MLYGEIFTGWVWNLELVTFARRERSVFGSNARPRRDIVSEVVFLLLCSYLVEFNIIGIEQNGMRCST